MCSEGMRQQAKTATFVEASGRYDREKIRSTGFQKNWQRDLKFESLSTEGSESMHCRLCTNRNAAAIHWTSTAIVGESDHSEPRSLTREQSHPTSGATDIWGDCCRRLFALTCSARHEESGPLRELGIASTDIVNHDVKSDSFFCLCTRLNSLSLPHAEPARGHSGVSGTPNINFLPAT